MNVELRNKIKKLNLKGVKKQFSALWKQSNHYSVKTNRLKTEDDVENEYRRYLYAIHPFVDSQIGFPDESVALFFRCHAKTEEFAREMKNIFSAIPIVTVKGVVASQKSKIEELYNEYAKADREETLAELGRLDQELGLDLWDRDTVAQKITLAYGVNPVASESVGELKTEVFEAFSEGISSSSSDSSSGDFGSYSE